ncbi:Fe-S cluster assembly protein SufD [Gilvimarinus xylanilyticus]|uniref:Fe-S cluster assembly protein SufD n=1 Tax=Gilvimarinus xylanilyticus TaxID=2944139 RepID=A0A9X2I142_9GAMM|nr:Fe-S cluster assembly protein SufD [Gilvimarinus xylanilyticus]MCP8898733.1 Fe-S cluster assembly protein SufD [Gilvimarinus xylanilyticus]
MGDLQTAALALAGSQQAPDWLASVRQRGAQRFAATPWPNRRTEQWKYTPLSALSGKSVQLPEPSGYKVPEADLIDVDAYRLVFINGVYSPDQSDSLPPEVASFSGVNDDQVALLQNHLGRLADSSAHLFAALGEATSAEGLVVHVKAGQSLDKPVYVVNYSVGEQSFLASTRVLVVLEAGAEAEVVEQFLSATDDQANLVTAHTEIVLGDNARVKHYRLNLEHEGITHAGGVFVELGRDAHFDGFAIAKGAELIRNDYLLIHRGSGAHVELNGVYMPRGRQVVDYHTNVQHRVPHCTSNEVFRGIIGDRAKAVFNGRIHIFADAQKTLAELSNKNLLTSNRAEIDTKPELEIYADDVKCAHGATVAQLDDEAIYYLQTRGIDKERAQVMMSFGFINELISNIQNEAVMNYLLPVLAKQFGRENDLLQLEADTLDAL